MEDVHPLVEVLIYFALGLVVAFVVIPLFIMVRPEPGDKKITRIRFGDLSLGR